MKYYVAYGSNLNLEEMKYRCPGIEPLGKGVLRGYRLSFRFYATIEKDLNSSIEVGVFRINDVHEKALDYYEGFPDLYRKELVDVEVGELSVKALSYVMNEKNIPYTMPESSYLIRCKEGYDAFHISTNQIEDAVLYTMNKILENMHD